MTRHTPALHAATLVLAATLASVGSPRAQIAAGQFAAVERDTTGVARLFRYEPLRGVAVAIDDPSGRLGGARAVALGPGRFLFVALVATSATVVRVGLSGDAVVSVVPFGPAFPAPITQLVARPDGSLLVATSTDVHGVAADGTSPPPLLQVAPTDRIAAIEMRGDTLAVLARRAAGGSALYVREPTGVVSVHALRMPAPTSIAFDPPRGAFVAGNALGDLYLIDGSRFVESFLVSAPAGAPIGDIRYNTDQSELSVGAGPDVYRLLRGALVGATPTPRNGVVQRLDYARYESRFDAYGNGCTSTAASPRIGAFGQPFPGNATFAVELSGAAADNVAHLLLGLLPRNLALDGVGMPACVLLVDPLDALAARTSALGRAIAPLPIPGNHALVGATVRVQWFAIVPGANRLGLLSSDGGRLLF